MQLKKSFFPEAIQAYNKGCLDEYREICQLLDDQTTEEDVLVDIFTGSRQCIALMDGSHSLLIMKLLKVPWCRRSSWFISEHSLFLISLAAGHAAFCQRVLETVVRKLLPSDGFGRHDKAAANVVEQTSEEQAMIYDQAHHLMQQLLRVVPTAKKRLVNVLSLCFPFCGRSTPYIRDYVSNCLKLASCYVDLRTDIITLVVENLLKLDAACSKEQMQEQCRLEPSADEVFQMDCVDTKAPSESQLTKLDECMVVMFDFFYHQCYDDDGNFRPAVAYPFCKDMINVFEQSVLSSHEYLAVPFLWFYICSFEEAFSSCFIKWLWRMVLSPSVPPNLRLNASCYLASILARAAYVSIETVLVHLQDWTAWLHQFIDTHDSGCSSSVAFCHTFYAVCQSLLYVIAFRIKEILALSNGYEFLEHLNLNRLVTCRFNPLRYCSPDLLTNFANVSRNYQFAFCYTVIERNRRSSQLYDPLTMSDQDFHLNSFFPFDPYPCEKSSVFIKKIYRKYENICQTKSERAAVLEKEEMIVADDFLMDGESVYSSSFNFQYAVSPGFKR